GAFAGGWWKADGSVFCDGARYYVDCMAECTSCANGCNPFCDEPCDSVGCGCALGDCNRRQAGCVRFRYGQCHQEIACSGRIACRVITCTPPYLLDPTCGTTAFTDQATANHTARCPPGPAAKAVLLRTDGRSGWILGGRGDLTPF